MDFIGRLIRQFGRTGGRSVLDVGCGTGQAAVYLARNFDVTGVDMSQTAIGIARKKHKKSGQSTTFVRADMTDFDLKERFDTCISLFSTLCYLTRQSDLKKALSNIRGHLKPSGLLIFDFWNADAVLHEKPATRVKIMNDRHRIVRIATPSVDYRRQVCSIDYHCMVLKGKAVIDEFSEIHDIKFHRLSDLKKTVRDAGFDILAVTQMGRRPQKESSYKDSWYLTIVARRK